MTNKKLTKAEMMTHLMQELSLSKQQARLIVEGFFEQITLGLSQQGVVKISGFGTFEVKEKSPRPGRNPKTGEPATIDARRVVSFRAGQKFRKRIKT